MTISPQGKVKTFYIAKFKIVYATLEEVNFVNTADDVKDIDSYPKDIKEVYPILKKYLESEIIINRKKGYPKEDRDTSWAVSLKLK
jgi:hypothetical protein